MNKFFTSSKPGNLQLPIAVIVRPLKHSPSTGNLFCTGALIRPQNSDVDPIITELPNRVNVSRGELVVQPTVQFQQDQATFILWQTTHPTIQDQNPQLASLSTEVFFLFGSPENCTDLNSTGQFLQNTFEDTQTFLIDYSGDQPQLKSSSSPFEPDKIVTLTSKNQDLFFDTFFSILKEINQLPQRAHAQNPSKNFCSIL